MSPFQCSVSFTSYQSKFLSELQNQSLPQASIFSHALPSLFHAVQEIPINTPSGSELSHIPNSCGYSQPYSAYSCAFALSLRSTKQRFLTVSTNSLRTAEDRKNMDTQRRDHNKAMK